MIGSCRVETDCVLSASFRFATTLPSNDFGLTRYCRSHTHCLLLVILPARLSVQTFEGLCGSRKIFKHCDVKLWYLHACENKTSDRFSSKTKFHFFKKNPDFLCMMDVFCISCFLFTTSRCRFCCSVAYIYSQRTPFNLFFD